MTARAMWKGRVAFGDFEVPVKLYAAARDQRVRFRMLDAERRAPVSQKMVDPASGEPTDDVRRGLEVERGVYVLLTDEELASLEPEADRAIDVVTFVAPEAVDPARHERPYYLGPDGEPERYGALAEALEAEGKTAIVRWAMRKRRYVGALRAEAGVLRLSTLRRLGEVVSPSAIDAPEKKIDPKEAKLAGQLVEALEDDFDLSEYRQTYRDAVAELLQKKARGERIGRPKKTAPKETPSDLEAALRESLAAAKKEKASA